MTKSGKHCGKKKKLLVFKEPSAAEASESVYMRERVKAAVRTVLIQPFQCKQFVRQGILVRKII